MSGRLQEAQAGFDAGLARRTLAYLIKAIRSREHAAAPGRADPAGWTRADAPLYCGVP
jgi:hypothetical protein